MCISRNSTTKDGFVQKEIKFALDVAEEKPEGKRYLIPALMEPCAVPERLRKWHWVDLSNEQGYSKLLQVLLTRTGAEGRSRAQVNRVPKRREVIYESGLLPIAPHVRSPLHRELVRMIFDYRDVVSRVLRDALERFETLDQKADQSGADHQLVQCLMYLVRGELRQDRERGDTLALEYAKRMAIAHPEMQAEFLFVIAWTARRLQRFQEAHAAAGLGIEKQPDDPQVFPCAKRKYYLLA